MKELIQFTYDQYKKIKNDFCDAFPNDGDVNTSAIFFSLMVGQYISDVIENSPNLDVDYHAALLEMLNMHVKNYIDMGRKDAKLEAVNWESGKSLLKSL